MDFYAVNCRPQALGLDWPLSFIMPMMCIVVAQKLRCLEDFEFKWQYIEMVYWLPKKTVCIVCTIVEHPITVTISVRNGSGLPGHGPPLERNRIVGPWLLPWKQECSADSGSGSNRTAVPSYGSYNFGSNSVFELSSYRDIIYTWNVPIDTLFHLQFPDLWSDQYSLSRFEIKLNITPK